VIDRVPPRLAEWLLRRTTPPLDRQALLGDLHEEYRARAGRAGVSQARRWYWQQTLRSLWPNLRRYHVTAGTHAAATRGSIMDATWMDARFAWRMVRRRKLVTAVAVLSLVAAMTAATVVFGLLNAVALRGLPVDRPDELALVLEQRDSGINHNFSYQDFLDYRTAQQTLTDLVAYSAVQPSLRLPSGSEPVKGELVSTNYFGTFGIAMLLGRALGPVDDDRGRPPVVVVSESLWRRLGAPPDRFEPRQLVLNGQPFGVVGVAAAPFRGMQVGRDARFWAPIHTQRMLEGADGIDLTTRPTASWLTLMGRRRPGVPPDLVAGDLNRVEAGLPRPATRPQPRRLIVESGRRGDSMLPVTAAAPLQLLLGAGGLLLLVACANVAGLQLTRTAERDRELSVRAALGASRGRLARLLLAEAVLLGAGATAITIAASLVLTRLAIPLLDLHGTSVALDVSPDWRVWSFVAALGAAAIAVFAVTPMIMSRRQQSPGRGLGDGTRLVGASGRGWRVSHGLIATQFAVSLALAVCCVLFIRTMSQLQAVPMGFDLDRIAVLEVDPTAGAGVPAARISQYLDATTRALSAMPGVAAVGYARVLPLDFGGARSTITVPGYEPRRDEDTEINWNRVSAGYFAAMGIAPVDGRVFDARDAQGAPLAGVVNDTMARHFWPGQRAVDRTFQLGRNVVTVVGVVPDVKYRTLREESGPTFYLAADQGAPSPGAFHVRTHGPVEPLVESLRRTVSSSDPTIPVIRARSLRDQAGLHMTRERLAMTIALVLATVALLLAAVGLYGAMSHAVGRRTREIGVRVALGAIPRDVRRLVLHQGLRLAAIGGAAGTALAAWLTSLIEHLLFGVQPSDVASFAASIALLAAVALLASWLPARRASRIDPVVALRE
jgi:predicted permease